jgi:hypothetical protein
MQLPRYYLPRPAFHLDAATIAACEALWADISTSSQLSELHYTLPIPRWQFLCYLTDHKPVVLHGSGNPHLTALEPRQPNDVLEFSNRHAIYAASDGIWPIYFAILDRDQYPMSLTNACLRVGTANGTQSDPFYFFSISQAALQHRPWRNGTIYLLPRATFEAQPPIAADDAEIHVMQWASAEQVNAIAKITVTPDDFPFLAQIRGHDDLVQRQRISANPDGFPWVDDEA